MRNRLSEMGRQSQRKGITGDKGQALRAKGAEQEKGTPASVPFAFVRFDGSGFVARRRSPLWFARRLV